MYNTSTSTWEAWRKFSTPSSVSLTTLSFTLASNIALSSSNTWVTIGSLNLSAGTWFVSCTATFWLNPTGARSYYTRLINLDNNTVYAGSQVFVPSASQSGAPITYSTFVPGGITITFQGATSVGSPYNLILANTTLGSVPATFMTAIKVA